MCCNKLTAFNTILIEAALLDALLWAVLAWLKLLPGKGWPRRARIGAAAFVFVVSCCLVYLDNVT